MLNKFDVIVDRRGTNSVKWDDYHKVFGRDDLLPMWVADSDWPAPEVVIKAIKERVNHGVFGYTEPGDELNKVVIDWVKRRYNWEIKPEWLVYISGVVPAINVALKSFTRPGGNVIVQPPVYYPFFTAVKKSGAKLIENPLVLKEHQYEMDFSDLEDKLVNISNKQFIEENHVQTENNLIGRDKVSKGKPANMIVLCSPHNPVGRVWSKEELQKLADLCLKYNILIISDEIHGDLVYSDNLQVPLASISEEIAMNTITMIAPSKTFNLAGLGSAVTIIPNKKMRKQFLKTMEGFVVSGNAIGFTAMKAAYSQGDEWLGEQLDYLEENRDYAVKYIDKNIPGLKAIKPEGTYLLWLDCRGLGFGKKELEKFMVEKAKIGLDAGAWFGSGGEGFMRLNMASSRRLLEDGLERIKKAVSKL